MLEFFFWLCTMGCNAAAMSDETYQFFLRIQKRADRSPFSMLHRENKEEVSIMSLWELLMIAVGLSMDAFAVSICKGLSVRKATVKQALCVGLYFGGFQMLMPLIGYLLGSQFESLITSIDHWIAFVLLGLIGGNMIREAIKNETEKLDDSFSVRTMLPLAVATSIDALAMGVTFAFLQVQIVPAVCFIGVITFLFSAAGLKVGNIFGAKFKQKAELLGGIVLVLMGIKILLEHLGILNF